MTVADVGVSSEIKQMLSELEQLHYQIVKLHKSVIEENILLKFHSPNKKGMNFSTIELVKLNLISLNKI